MSNNPYVSPKTARGRKGAAARNQTLTAERRSEIAKNAAAARWGNRALEVNPYLRSLSPAEIEALAIRQTIETSAIEGVEISAEDLACPTTNSAP